MTWVDVSYCSYPRQAFCCVLWYPDLVQDADGFSKLVKAFSFNFGGGVINFSQRGILGEGSIVLESLRPWKFSDLSCAFTSSFKILIFGLILNRPP